jgi:hypothetical protein
MTTTNSSPKRVRIAARAAAAAAVSVGAILAPVGAAEAATTSVFSSTYNLGVSACRYSSTAIKYTVRPYGSTPIYRVSMVNSSGSGSYVDYIPGYYGAKTQAYAQVTADGTKYVKLKRTSSSSTVNLGSFYLRKSGLAAC